MPVSKRVFDSGFLKNSRYAIAGVSEQLHLLHFGVLDVHRRGVSVTVDLNPPTFW